MNLVLLWAADVEPGGAVVVRGRQAAHLRQVLRVEVGSDVAVGIANGIRGRGTVAELLPGGEVLLELNAAPEDGLPPLVEAEGNAAAGSECGAVPRPWWTRPRTAWAAPVIDIVLALPRPKTFGKVLQFAASFGVRRIIVGCASRTEAGYLSSPKLSRAAILQALQLGLEQSRSTAVPEVHVFASWAALCVALRNRLLDPNPQQLKLVAHLPDDGGAVDSVGAVGLLGHEGAVAVAIGPEGGFLTNEVQQLTSLGFVPCSLGDKTLRVEVAVCAAVAQIQLMLTEPILRTAPVPPPLEIAAGDAPLEEGALKVLLPVRGCRPPHHTPPGGTPSGGCG